MIGKIIIRNIATYDQLGITLDGLREINFIYGNNGSGKTTLSEFLRNSGMYPNCSLEWQGRSFKISVYNRNFVNENFRMGNSIKGIFTLGKESVELQSEIFELKEKIKQHDEAIFKLSETSSEKITELDRIIDNFKDSCWEIKKKIDLEFKESIEGFRNSRDRFMTKFLEEASNNSREVRPLEELRKLKGSLFELKGELVNRLSEILFESHLEEDPIFREKILGKEDVDIARLITKLQISDWVKQGHIVLKGTEGICPFCQQSLSDLFEEKLNSYFDQTYIENIQRLETASKKYIENVSNAISQIEMLLAHSKGEFIDKNKLQSTLILIKSRLEENRLLIENKSKEPSRSIELVKVSNFFYAINQEIIESNQKIIAHNKLIENIKMEKENLSKDVWRYINEQNISNYQDFINKKGNIDKVLFGLEKSTEQKKQYKKQFEQGLFQKQQQVTSVEYSVTEINKILFSFGFKSFRLASAEEKGNYKIVRENGEDANETLSEGEKTFITFLYYYQLLKGSNEINDIQAEKIVVIDDPISSLDSSVLFMVSSLVRNIMFEIKENSSDIKQLFVLTHNIYFHKEVTFSQGNKSFGDATYWILRKNNETTTIEPFDKNPIRSSYELLWKELRNSNNHNFVSIQNIMRRILENYFKFFGDTNIDDLESEFENEEKMICRSLLSWINDGSHSISEDLYVESNIDLVDRYLGVFKSIFDKKNHIAHYKMMMKDFDIVNQDTVSVRAVEEISTGLREVAGSIE
ncbi:AAA family ATPase [Paenibacillus pasadenensis]|uniref:AAA family ATPase n=1 Tax=Paenibacillus pasadenensis TaxID=217090 RepID=UPI00203AE4A6|nr:AAA family ATPase [Paenibacillus pasadenensis]MCM3749276.1 AAA family ATPase [Paenibacillus pasadenensis]